MGFLIKLYNQKQKWDFGTPKTSKLRKLQFWNYLFSIFESWISDSGEIRFAVHWGKDWFRSRLLAKCTFWKLLKPPIMFWTNNFENYQGWSWKLPSELDQTLRTCEGGSKLLGNRFIAKSVVYKCSTSILCEYYILLGKLSGKLDFGF